jgi:MrfA Zn-binding domain
VKAALDGITDEEVLAEIRQRRDDTPRLDKSVKVAELETLITAKEELGNDRPNGNFFARALPRAAWDRPWMRDIERIVLVHRLREVVAQVGFTRFEAAAPDIEGELEMGVRRASLAREVSWLPAVENRGEGIFIQFKSEAIERWAGRQDAEARGRKLDSGFFRWKDEHQGTHRVFPGLPYLMLHSFSHMLITAVALECGYPASSIRERVYALPGIGYGVLLYTGTSDAEGTLGGLIQVGRRIHEHIHAALEQGELCSNDPVCAQHEPENVHEHRFLHGAACHGCLLIAETSCEQQNDFLDRALVVRTVENLGVEFFRAAQP